MAQCPDCDSVKIRLFEDEGDGVCSVCHGSGGGGMLDDIGDAMFGSKTECYNCGGSGECPTCDGTGVVDDDDEEDDNYEEEDDEDNEEENDDADEDED